jgi:hypothetical protein
VVRPAAELIGGQFRVVGEREDKKMTRRTTLLLSMMAAALLATTVVAGVAWAATFTCVPGSTKEDPCEGTRRADVITGTSGPDFIIAKSGNDLVRGKEGNDVIRGMPGNDRLYGGAGDDQLNDLAGPRLGNSEDADFLLGGTGADFYNVWDGDQLDVVCFGPGGDGATGDGRDDFGEEGTPPGCG